jgi:hypothetical protein
VGDPRDLGDRLDRADLVVGMHHAHEDGARRERAPDIVGIDAARPVDREIGDAGALALEEAAWGQDRRVLDLTGDDLIAGFASGEEDALERQIVGLAATAGEHHLARPTAQQRGEGLPKASARSCRTASATRGSTGVLAL